MVIGQNIAIFRNDNAGAESLLAILFLFHRRVCAAMSLLLPAEKFIEAAAEGVAAEKLIEWII